MYIDMCGHRPMSPTHLARADTDPSKTPASCCSDISSIPKRLKVYTIAKTESKCNLALGPTDRKQPTTLGHAGRNALKSTLVTH